jgi:hypothetical protein
VKRDDIRKLLGGYATGTLTDAERKALFEAAMEDQTLFDTIADEGVLKELLDDPQARAYLLEALPARQEPVVRRIPAWSWAAAASVAATLVIGALLVRTPVPPKPAAPRVMASLQLKPELEAPARFKVEPQPQVAKPVAKQKSFAPADVLSKQDEASSAAAPAASPAAPLPQPDRDAREGAETDVKVLLADKESAAPVAVAENRKKVEVSASTGAVNAQPALPRQSVDSTTLSTAAGVELPLLDSAVQTQQTARQLFYSPVYSGGAAAGFITDRRDAPREKRAVARPAGTPGLRYTLLRRQPGGSYLEADPTAIFHAGDAIRLSVETNAPGYLAVWNGRAALANLSVLARTKYTIPTEGAIDLNGPPGDRKLLVVFSRALQTKPAGQAAGLLVEQSTERATYVADPRPSALVSFEISLAYR